MLQVRVFDKDEVSDDSLGLVDVPVVESDFTSSGASSMAMRRLPAPSQPCSVLLLEKLMVVQQQFFGNLISSVSSVAASSCP